MSCCHFGSEGYDCDCYEEEQAQRIRDLEKRIEEGKNKMKEESITITKKEYSDLKRKALWLHCLEDAGVDNWSGIDFAYDLKDELNEKK